MTIGVSRALCALKNILNPYLEVLSSNSDFVLRKFNFPGESSRRKGKEIVEI